jgi:type II secretory pathway component PulK
MRFHLPRTSAGIALIIVMISITVLAILAAGFAYSMKVETRLAQNANSETELMWLGLSGVEKARWILAQQLSIAQEPYDALNQMWAGGPGSMNTSNSPLAGVTLDLQLGNGSARLKITDLERKANINVAEEFMLEQALRLVGVDAGDFSLIVGSIQDWIDPDDNTHIGGTESQFYESLDPPYYAKNKPIDDLSELLLINGMTPAIYWGGVATEQPQRAYFQNQPGFAAFSGGGVSYAVGFVDFFTPISSGRININTASLTTLQMILVDENIAAEVIQLRSGPDGVDGTEDDTPFRNAGELINVPGISRQAVAQLQRICDVRSRTFEVQVDVEVNGYKRQFVAIVGRSSPRDLPVLSFHWK